MLGRHAMAYDSMEINCPKQTIRFYFFVAVCYSYK